jgi:hypothetical protein
MSATQAATNQSSQSTSSNQFDLNTFLLKSRTQRIRLPKQLLSDGGLVNFTMPSTGLLSGIMLNIQGTIQISGTTGGYFQPRPYPAPYSCVKNVSLSSNQNLNIIDCSLSGLYSYTRLRYGIDVASIPNSPFDAGNSEINGTSFLSYNNFQESVTPIAGNAVSNGLYTVAISQFIPVAYNRECLAGLLPLQNNSIQYILQLTCGNIAAGISATGGSNDFFQGLTGTGITITSNLTASVDVEIKEILRNYPTPTNMFMSLQEQVQTPLNQGQNQFKLPITDLVTFTKLTVFNGGHPELPTNLSNPQWSFSGNLLQYNENYNNHMGWIIWNNGVVPMDGEIVYDFGTRKGLLNKRDLFDAFNDTTVTDLTVSFGDAAAPTGNNGVIIFTESLRYATQR